MYRLELSAGNKAIRFECDGGELKWCELFLIDGQKIKSLGAEVLHTVVSKLIMAFTDSQEEYSPYFAARGRKCRWVMNLMGPHSSVFAEKIGGGIRLIFPDRDEEAELSEKEITEWTEKIIRFCCDD